MSVCSVLVKREGISKEVSRDRSRDSIKANFTTLDTKVDCVGMFRVICYHDTIPLEPVTVSTSTTTRKRNRPAIGEHEIGTMSQVCNVEIMFDESENT